MTRTDDEGYLGRVYVTSVIVWAVGCVLAWWLWGMPAAAGWTVGCGVSMGVLRAFEWIVRRSFVPGAANATKDFAKFSALKLPIVILVIAAVVVVGGRSLSVVGSFCAGVLLTQGVIVARTVGAAVAKARVVEKRQSTR